MQPKRIHCKNVGELRKALRQFHDSLTLEDYGVWLNHENIGTSEEVLWVSNSGDEDEESSEDSYEASEEEETSTSSDPETPW
mgnify:CR=1 FL=1